MPANRGAARALWMNPGREKTGRPSVRLTDAAAASIALLALAAPAFAERAAATPQAVPVPQARPQPTPAEKGETPAKAGDAAAEPLPESDASQTPPAGPPVRDMLAESDADFAACTAALAALGARFETTPPVTDPAEPDCGIARPLVVSEIVPGVALRPQAVLRCETALALAGWTRDFVVPAARRLPGRGALTRIDHGTAYLCRPRNGVSGAVLSEHAFGNAVDIAGFGFERGTALAVTARAGEGSLEEAFQAAVRKAACLSFTTVLGPGTDEAHADHLHLDVKARGGGFRLCQ